jgi:imidazolonepropionase-like amidohydrolase
METIVLKGGRLINGTGRPPMEDAVVCIENGRFKTVGNLNEIAVTTDETVIDTTGKTLIPGLINLHVHLCLDPKKDSQSFCMEESTVALALQSLKNARIALAHGVTSVRDLGAKEGVNLEVKRAIEAGWFPGPRIFASGPCITAVGGHGHFIGTEVQGADQVREAVKKNLDAGADVIKFMASGGLLTSGGEGEMAVLSEAELKAGVDEAHRAGIRTAAHATTAEGVRAAASAGIDTIEHATFVDDEGVRMIMERGAAVIITLAAPYLVEFMGSKAGIKPEVLEKSRGRFQQKIKSYKMLMEKGIRIGVGSDAGTPLNEHHDFAREIELMVQEGGISPLEAIQAATQLGAMLLGCEDRIGTVEKGKLADLVILSEDPLADIKNLRTVEMVFINGKAYPV